MTGAESWAQWEYQNVRLFKHDFDLIVPASEDSRKYLEIGISPGMPLIRDHY